MRDTVKRAALGLFEILVESDGPIGYELLAQAVEGISRRFALRLKECAASRGGGRSLAPPPSFTVLPFELRQSKFAPRPGRSSWPNRPRTRSSTRRSHRLHS